MRHSQKGSGHLVVIAVLAVALIGALGVLFWQNVVNKPTDTADTDSIGKAAATTTPTPTLKTYCAPIEKLCFEYPNDWKATAEKVNSESEGVAERVVVSDQTGKSWLRLETGMGGLGGMCFNDDGSKAKIIKTHTTKIAGSYLINESAKAYMSDTAYAIGWVLYSGTDKQWMIDMEVNNSKAVQNIGQLDPCDIGIGVLNGKNAKAEGSTSAGAVAFKYYLGNGSAQKYATEAEATKALESTEAVKAYDVLQSVRYE